MKDEVVKRTKLLVNTELKDTNLIASINSKVISVAEYLMNICKFSIWRTEQACPNYKKGIEREKYAEKIGK